MYVTPAFLFIDYTLNVKLRRNIMELFDFLKKSKEQLAYEVELNSFRDIYMSFVENDINSFNNIFKINELRDLSAEEFHKANMEFLKEVMESKGFTGEEIIERCPNLAEYVNTINYEKELENFYSLYTTFYDNDINSANFTFSINKLNEVTPEEFHKRNIEFVRETMEKQGIPAKAIIMRCPNLESYVKEIKDKEIKFDLTSEAKEYAKKHPMQIRDFEPKYKNDQFVQLEAIKSNGNALQYCDIAKDTEEYVRIAMQTEPKAYVYANDEIRNKIGTQMEAIAKNLSEELAYKLAELNIEVKNISESDDKKAYLSVNIPPLHNIEFSVSAKDADTFAQDLKNRVDSLPLKALESKIEEFTKSTIDENGREIKGIDVNVKEVAQNVYDKLQGFATDIKQFQTEINALKEEKNEPAKKKASIEKD